MNQPLPTPGHTKLQQRCNQVRYSVILGMPTDEKQVIKEVLDSVTMSVELVDCRWGFKLPRLSSKKV
jgi:hypothetical protein